MNTSLHLPTYDQVLYECIHAEAFVANFNKDCATKLAFHQVPDLVNNHLQLDGTDRVNIDLFIDYVLNFAYIPIICNSFDKPLALPIFKD